MEKKALLDLQAGGEGEKSSLIASSQKALAKAAQLVADAAEMRKREAQAVVDKIDSQIYRQLSGRLESLLPQSSVASEVSAIKGELLASKVVDKASQSLIAISKSFDGVIRPYIPDDWNPGEAITSDDASSIMLSDEMKAELVATFYQTEFAHEITEVSSKFVRILAAGLWPDQMQPAASAELGSLVGHNLSEVDNVLGEILQSLKEEGSLRPEQSNIEQLRQATATAMHSLESEMERKEGTLIPKGWNPPGLELMKSISLSKFSCLGALAAVSAVVHSSENSSSDGPLTSLYGRVEQCSSQIAAVVLRLAHLDVKNSKLVAEIEVLVTSLLENSGYLLQTVKDAILSAGDVTLCESAVDQTLRDLAKLSSVLRSSNLNQNDDGSLHPLSFELNGTWERLSSMAQDLRAVDGDIEDLNCFFRARQVEQRLEQAVENVPQLEMAQTKIVSLEKVCTIVVSVRVFVLELTFLFCFDRAWPHGRKR